MIGAPILRLLASELKDSRNKQLLGQQPSSRALDGFRLALVRVVPVAANRRGNVRVLPRQMEGDTAVPERWPNAE